jgi:uncharacterized protein YbjT (DUF2867 family)
MDIVIAGGHGSIALLLTHRLAAAGHSVRGLIRNPDHSADLTEAGATPVVIDLEAANIDEVAAALDGADAVVFAAGAGPGSGAARKLTLDRDGAITVARATASSGIRRLVVISSIGADETLPDTGDDFTVYLRAKGEADAVIRGLDLDWTIVRPVTLTDEDATGLIDLAGEGTIARADVAAIVAELLESQLAVHGQFEVTGGGTPVRTALESL